MYDEGPSAAGIIGGILVTALIIGGIVFAFSGVKAPPAPAKTDLQASNEVQKDLVQAVPIPELTGSSERENVSRRAQLFNQPDKVTYIYLVSYGKVMAFYPVTGKVSSLRSYMSPVDKLIDYKGRPCDAWSSGSTCYIVEAPDIDGTYGENVDGIFFFTTDGAYVEWKGEYMVSDQPLKLTTQPELVREIK